MPRYYFDLRDDNSLIRDDDGLELADLNAAQNQAIRALTDIARDRALAAFDDFKAHDLEIEVRDDSGPVMFARLKLDSSQLH